LYYPPIIQSIILFFLRNTRFAQLISVSYKLSDFLNKKAIKNICLPAYVPSDNIHFIKMNNIEGKEYFLYSIWKLDREIAQNVYNIELAFELLNRIREKFHMLFLIGTEIESDKEYLSYLLQKYEVKNSVTLIYESQLTDYLNNCRFLLRTNNSDGYGVSLQEALDLGVPAVASNVCIRPKGTILFEKGNIDDLLEKVENIDKYWDENAVESPNYHLQLIEIYKKFLF
jgi:glycosyltransferase involved in cell wall biosynthesis